MRHNNNFDLLRLFAALQVAYGHGVWHLGIENSVLLWIRDILAFFPGVPIFFFISGYLVYQSWERNQKDLKRYFRNRSLRIFPALIGVSVIGLVLVVVFKPTLVVSNTKDLLVWFFGQVSFFQFYTPDVIRYWGVGTPNGSLWTISVELQFYLLLPFLGILFKGKYGNYFILSAILIFWLLNFLAVGHYYEDLLFGKLLGVSITSYLFFFLLGMLGYKNRTILAPLFTRYFGAIVGVFVILCAFDWFRTDINMGSYWLTTIPNIVFYLILCLLVIGFAHSKRFLLITKELKGIDLSYGIYVYHMLVINTLVALNFTSSSLFLLLMLIITIVLGYLSWKLIEKPFLLRK